MITRADIQFIRLLATDSAARRANSLFVVEGAKCVGEAMASRLVVDRLFLTADSTLHSPAAEIVTPKEMERLSSFRTPSDALAVVRMPSAGGRTFEPDELILALDDVQDPGNLGTIIRVADWFGIGRVVCSTGSADCYNPKVVQASMGALLRVDVSYADLEVWLADVHTKGFEIYGAALDGDNIYSADLTRGGVVVMGNEGHGIGAATSRLLTRRIFIPPYPADRRGSESLNVAVATAVVCNEFRRRTNR